MGVQHQGLLLNIITKGDPARPIIAALGSSLALWLEARLDAAWVDRGPSAHTINAVGTPDYNTNSVNGKPVVTFSGDDYFAIPTLGVALAGADVAYSTWTVISGFVGTDVAYWSLGNTGTATQFERYFDTTNVFRFQRRDDSNTAINAVSGAASLVSGWQILATRYPGTTISSWNNGVNKANAAAYNAGTCTFNTSAIGCLLRTSAANLFAGQIAAHIVLLGAASAANLNLVQNYLAARYGIAVSQIT